LFTSEERDPLAGESKILDERSRFPQVGRQRRVRWRKVIRRRRRRRSRA